MDCAPQTFPLKNNGFTELCWNSAVNLYRANGCGGFGLQTAADPHWWPPQSPWKADLGYCDSISQMLSLQTPSSSLNAGTGKRGCLGRGEAFGWPAAICPPKRLRPFAYYRVKCRLWYSWFFVQVWVLKCRFRSLQCRFWGVKCRFWCKKKKKRKRGEQKDEQKIRKTKKRKIR